jgi:hypothetical protein
MTQEPPQVGSPSATRAGQSGTVVRTRPTKAQKSWWGYLVFFGGVSAAGLIGIIYEHGPERGLWMALVSVAPLVGVGAFYSGKFLRQRRTAEATLLTLSDDGILAIVEPGNEVARSLVGVRGVSFHHGKAVPGMHGARFPDSLSSSAAYGAVVIDTGVGREVLVYTGELPLKEQETLLRAAGPFLAPGAETRDATASTPDERSDAAAFRRKLADFGLMMGTILVFLLPAFALIVIDVARRGHLDPNTLWFAILICGGGLAVVIVRLVRRWRRSGASALDPQDPPAPVER